MKVNINFEADTLTTQLDFVRCANYFLSLAQLPNVSTPTPPVVDITGLPWDERLHSSNKTFNADGRWRKKKDISVIGPASFGPEIQPILFQPADAVEINVVSLLIQALVDKKVTMEEFHAAGRLYAGLTENEPAPSILDLQKDSVMTISVVSYLRSQGKAL